MMVASLHSYPRECDCQHLFLLLLLLLQRAVGLQLRLRQGGGLLRRLQQRRDLGQQVAGVPDACYHMYITDNNISWFGPQYTCGMRARCQLHRVSGKPTPQFHRTYM